MSDINDWIMGPQIEEAFIGDLGSGMESYKVGRNGITRIDRSCHGGMACDIPYVLIWRGDEQVGEYCLHQIVGVTNFTTHPAKEG